MSRHRRSDAEERYARGIKNAESKGFAAGLDQYFSETDNPYKRYEHRSAWLAGFKRSRAKGDE